MESEATSLGGRNWLEYRQRLLRFVRSKVHNDAIAEDIVHDVLVKAWEKRATQRGSMMSWLFQITMNAVRDHYRVRRVEPLMDDMDVADEPTRDDLQQLFACMSTMVDDLEEPYRSTFVRSEFDGIPMPQIAAELGMSVSGVKSRVQRARARVRTALLDCCALERNQRGEITNAAEHECEHCAPL
jgi:RNA polymerase sigma-70 factor (ECF subfamily)